MKRTTRKVLALMLAITLCVTQLTLPVMAETITPDPAAAPAADSSANDGYPVVPDPTPTPNAGPVTNTDTNVTVSETPSSVEITEKTSFSTAEITNPGTSVQPNAGVTPDPNTSSPDITTTTTEVGKEAVVTTHTSDSSSQKVTGSAATNIDTEIVTKTTNENQELSMTTNPETVNGPDNGKQTDLELKDKQRSPGTGDETNPDTNDNPLDPNNPNYVKDDESVSQVGQTAYSDIKIQSDSYNGMVTMTPPQSTVVNLSEGETAPEAKHYDGTNGQPGYTIEHIKNTDGDVIGYTRTDDSATFQGVGTTVTATVTLTPEQAADPNLVIPAEGTSYDASGAASSVVSYNYDASGNFTGYTVTGVQGTPVVLTNEQIAAGNFPAEGSTTEADGTVSVVKYTYDANNKLTGYTVTKVKTTAEDTTVDYGTPTAAASATTSEPTPAGPPVVVGSDPNSYSAKTGVTYKVGTEDILDANGKKIGTKTTEPITQKDATGNEVLVGGKPVIIGYKITEVVDKDVALPGEKTTSDPNGTDGHQATILPSRPVPAADAVVNGMTVKEVVEDILDNSGNIIGYRTTQISYLPDGKEFGRSSESIYATAVSATSELKETPESAIERTTTVTEVYGELETQLYTQDVSGTTTNTRIISQEAYTLIPTGNGELLASIEGTIYKVQAVGSHGKMTFSNTRTPDSGLIPVIPNGSYYYSHWVDDDTQMKLSGGISDQKVAEGFRWVQVGTGLESAIRVGYSGGSNLLAHQFVLEGEDANGNPQTFYVYCADFETSAVTGESYNMDNVRDAGYITGGTEAEKEQKAEKMETIATNGYWGVVNTGTSENPTPGSLDAIKKLLRDAYNANPSAYPDITLTMIDNLTDGQALTGTQTALWSLGNSGTDTLNSSVVGNITENQAWSYVDKDGKSYRYSKDNELLNDYRAHAPNSRDTETVALTNAVFKMLTNLNPATHGTGGATELLDTDNFATSVTMGINGKVTTMTLQEFEAKSKAEGTNTTDVYTTKTVQNANGTQSIIDTKSGAELFDAQIAFTLAVEASDLTGNLNVKVVDEYNRTIAKRAITTSDSNLLGKILATDKGDGTTELIFKDLVLANGVKVTLKIEGTQDMEEGAYLFTAANYQTAQTYIGVGSGTHTVDLEVSMKFEVNDPQLEIKKLEWDESDTDTHTRRDELVDQDVSITTTQTVTTQTIVKGTKVLTRTVNERTRKAREWNSYMEYLMTLASDEDGGTGAGGGAGDGAGGNPAPGGLTIPDEAVPLAAAPKTGDISLVLALICLISLGGAYALSRKKQF